MEILAFTLSLVFLFLAFVVRGAIQRRRTGDIGFRFGHEPVGTPQWWSKLAFVIALVGGLAAPLLALAGWVEPIAALDRRPVQIVGTVLAVVGIVGVFVAQLAMGASWRVGVDPNERTELVTGGPFELVRNPIFTTMIATATGIALMVPSVLALASLVVLVGAIRYQVVAVEEPYLRANHRATYDGYASRVGRFIPGIGTFRVDRVRVDRVRD